MLAGGGGANEFSAWKGFIEMDEFPLEESRIWEAGYKLLIWLKGKRNHYLYSDLLI